MIEQVRVVKCSCGKIGVIGFGSGLADWIPIQGTVGWVFSDDSDLGLEIESKHWEFQFRGWNCGEPFHFERRSAEASFVNRSDQLAFRAWWDANRVFGDQGVFLNEWLDDVESRIPRRVAAYIRVPRG